MTCKSQVEDLKNADKLHGFCERSKIWQMIGDFLFF